MSMKAGSDKISIGSQRTAAQTTIAMSELLFQFGQICRLTKMPNGEFESDSHHSFTLAVIGYELAKLYAPELDAMKVMAYGLVHDLPEVVSGDVPTLLASTKELVEKKQRDMAAVSELRRIFGVAPNIIALVEAYDSCADEEAKFVFWLDKTMTILTHFFDAGQNLRELGVRDRPAIEAWYERLQHKLSTYAGNPHQTVVDVLQELYEKMHDELFPVEGEVRESA